MPLDRTGIDAIQDDYRKWKEDFYDKTFVEPNLRDFMMVTTQDGLVFALCKCNQRATKLPGGTPSKGCSCARCS